MPVDDSDTITHGFALPDFNIVQGLESGQTTELSFVAYQPGTFNFFCKVYCGAGQAPVAGQLIVK